MTAALRSPAAEKPAIQVLATGGTIAGFQAGSGAHSYQAGHFQISDLLGAIPGINHLARLSGEQVANIGSQDMNDGLWLQLARKVNGLLGSSQVDGVVMTHGTDTLEETAYFLHLVIKSDKPVVLVGSMRPATALSADGPGNLYNAVAVAANAGALRRGVLVVINDEIHSARDVTKTHTTKVETFRSPHRGLQGTVHIGEVAWFGPLERRHTTGSELSVDGAAQLPRVDVLHAHANMSPDLIDAAVKNGAQGLVMAGVGQGNMARPALDALAAAVKRGVAVVRSTRVQSGRVLRNCEVDDDQMGFVASGDLNPAKARVLLQLALLRTHEPKEIQRMFNTH